MAAVRLRMANAISGLRVSSTAAAFGIKSAGKVAGPSREALLNI